MRQRIAPRETRPAHSIEIGYLRDLTIAVKVEFYNIERNTYTRPLSLELLYEWTIQYREPLSRCRKFINLERSGHTEAVHRKEVAFIDGLIEKLRKGINDGAPVRHITLSDIESLEVAYRSLDVCQEKLVWY